MQQESELAAITANRPKWFDQAIAMPRKEGTVDVDGCPIFYMEWGDPASPGIIMVPGLIATLRCFSFIAPLLSRDYHVVAFDLSGQGDSGVREDYPESARAAEVLSVAEHTGLFNNDEKPLIIAHSYGATIAFAAIEAASRRFGGIIILEMMTLRSEQIEAFRSGNAVRGDAKPHRVYPDLETAMGAYKLGPVQPCENEYLLQYSARHSLREVEGGWAWKYSPNLYANDYRTNEWWAQQPIRLVQVPGRKAIIYGGLSPLFSQDSIDYLCELGGSDIPIIELPEAYHQMMLDQPLALTSALRAILSIWRTS